jgi:hypothetical protein
MKKISPLIVIILITFQLQAQHKPVVFGLRVAGNLGWMKPDNQEYSSDGVVPGFTWGFISEFYLMENYAIVTGFNMNFNGAKMQYPELKSVMVGDLVIYDTVQLSRKYNLKFIEIPLVLKMQTSLNDKITLFGKIGVGTAFCLSARASDDYTLDGTDYSTDKTNIDNQIALMKESLIVGGGVQYIIKGSTALIFDLTYDNAFNNILTEPNLALPKGTDPKAIYNYVEIGVGIVF